MVPAPVRVGSAEAQAAAVRPGGEAGRRCLERSARRARWAQARELVAGAEPVEVAGAGRATSSEWPR